MHVNNSAILFLGLYYNANGHNERIYNIKSEKVNIVGGKVVFIRRN